MTRRSFRTDSIAKSMGFQEFFGYEDMPERLLNYPMENSKYGWDYETMMFAKNRIDQSKRQFFAFAMLNTDHTPFPRLPKQFMKHPHHSTEESGYLNSLSYTDWSIGQFIESAKLQPWFDNTIFVITSDHVIPHYNQYTFPERFRVPLILYAPKIFAPGRRYDTSSQLDLMPTMLRWLGVDTHYTSLGQDLMRQKDNFAMVVSGSNLGAITDHGYISHSTRDRLEWKLFNSSSPATKEAMQYIERLENKLLAIDQLSYQLIYRNRWAR